ncbi:aminoacylase-1A-like protein [Gonapodya prolifera JEL478]|uniref:N-acyl-aliphatic-L-amino acid amidohydrolase n=1 Tax=Gonapodya prolifera (strain JEL478) TaxID=1344416 RepID=A0A138ZWI6_GONPJ|nr:aminoacylase-1A-like protein [Gonapodya prolifera JEL478]|eukprot:KXS08862.1 aminoacylase-1A-like protein [Gonapodya prolifera JEL478]
MPSSDLNGTSPAAEPIAVTRYREYLRIKTVHPEPDYEGAVQFLRKYADEVQLPIDVIPITPKKSMVIMKWEGSDSSKPALGLTSHMDVVPVFPALWSHDPFAATKLPNGDIVARGAQDMKPLGVQYVEAIRRLKTAGWSPKRNVWVIFTTDEEIGSLDGMAKFVQTEKFREMNLGCVLDEGIPNPNEGYNVYYGERAPWWLIVTATGPVGHASQFIPDSAGVKLNHVISKLLEFRKSEEKRMKTNKLGLGEVVSLNWTIAGGGVQFNVVPASMTAKFDIRVPPTVSNEELVGRIRTWCKEAGDGVSFAFDGITGPRENGLSKMEGEWWEGIERVAKRRNMPLYPSIFPAATDSRFLRSSGVPSFGLSPIQKTPNLLHDHNEYLNEATFLEGVEWYVDVMKELAGSS